MVHWKAVGETALKVGKAIYDNPIVQDKWKGFKKRNKLEYLPFGKKRMGKRRRTSKFKYSKGVRMI